MSLNNAVNKSGEAPIGMIVSYDFTAPSSWLACDGDTLDTTTYATLFAVIGYEYGGSGTSFDLPTASDYIIRYQ